MADLATGISLDNLASGFIGIILLGMIIKKMFDGYVEARQKIKDQAHNPIFNAMAMTWDRDQQERFIQLIERMATASESQATSMEALVSRQQQEMQNQINFLVETVTKMEKNSNRDARSAARDRRKSDHN